jgi:hypothetical protein
MSWKNSFFPYNRMKGDFPREYLGVTLSTHRDLVGLNASSFYGMLQFF